ARRRLKARKIDASGFADDASPAVAADEIFCTQRSAVGERDVDVRLALRKSGHRAAAIDRHLELAHPLAKQALDLALPEAEAVGMARGEIADVEFCRGVAIDLRDLSGAQETLGLAALIEHLDGAGVETAGARAAFEILRGAPLDDGDVDAGELQFGGERQ